MVHYVETLLHTVIFSRICESFCPSQYLPGTHTVFLLLHRSHPTRRNSFTSWTSCKHKWRRLNSVLIDYSKKKRITKWMQNDKGKSVKSCRYEMTSVVLLLLLDFLLHQAGNLTSPLIIFALSPHFSSIWCNTVLFSSYPSWMFACES